MAHCGMVLQLFIKCASWWWQEKGQRVGRWLPQIDLTSWQVQKRALRSILQLASDLGVQAEVGMSWRKRQAVAACLVVFKSQLELASGGGGRRTVATSRHPAWLPSVSMLGCFLSWKLS
jgi:hypothetical protein